jgi:hypothetical protein
MIVVLFWMSKIIDLRNYGCKGKPYFQYSQIIREENAHFLRKYPLFVHFFAPFLAFYQQLEGSKGCTNLRNVL